MTTSVRAPGPRRARRTPPARVAGLLAITARRCARPRHQPARAPPRERVACGEQHAGVLQLQPVRKLADEVVLPEPFTPATMMTKAVLPQPQFPLQRQEQFHERAFQRASQGASRLRAFFLQKAEETIACSQATRSRPAAAAGSSSS